MLTRLVPERLRDDFAAVYAFCRCSDDLADEVGRDVDARARATRLLEWWRRELRACFASARREPGAAEGAGHPVFVALRETITRHPALPEQPFHDLLDAFVQDQSVTRHQTWDQVIGYCARSADPVGRIVLSLAGLDIAAPENAERVRRSDAICTALQLTNHWQDVRRDLLERDRVYLPSKETGLDAETLRAWADRPEDSEARVAYIKALRPLVVRTRTLFEQGRALPKSTPREVAPVIWLFLAGGEATLTRIERVGCATLWTRPTLSKPAKLALVTRAWLMSLRGGGAR